MHDRRGLADIARCRSDRSFHLQLPLLLLLALGALAADLGRRGGDGERPVRHAHHHVGDAVRLALERVVHRADRKLCVEAEGRERRLAIGRNVGIPLKSHPGPALLGGVWGLPIIRPTSPGAGSGAAAPRRLQKLVSAV
jgi:hypothetical protein